MSELELKRNNFYVRSYRKIRKWRYYTRIYYELLNFLYRKHSDWRCINYGYLPVNDSDSPNLEPEEESERLALSLYHYTASKLSLKGLDVLEVGSVLARPAYPDQPVGQRCPLGEGYPALSAYHRVPVAGRSHGT